MFGWKPQHVCVILIPIAMVITMVIGFDEIL